MLDQAIPAMQHGDHFCLFYHDPEEQMATVVPFIAAGLDRGERCVFFGSEREVGRLRHALAARQVDVGGACERGGLVLESGHGYLVDGRFDPDAMIGFLEVLVDDAMARGFTGWRATGDSHWEMGPSPDYSKLVRYEGLLDRFFHNRPMVGMCQHDLRCIPTEVVPALLASHRKIVLNGSLQDSYCYRHPLADGRNLAGVLAGEGERPKRHLELMLSAVSEAVFAHDLSGKLAYVNRPGRRLLAIPAYLAVFEEIGSATAPDMVFEDEAGRPLPGEKLPWRVALRQHRPSEKFLRSRDPWAGHHRWWLVKSMPLFEGADEFEYCVTVVEDVTERRALQQANERLAQKVAETERLNRHISYQHTLFREVHHRIKNNLQLLSGLVTMLQAGGGGDPAEALAELHHRIGAIGMVHELLYRHGKEAAVDLGEYVAEVADSVWASCAAREKGIVLKIDAAPCVVHMDTAIPVGLILTEMLMNATKHAFPPGREGSVTVTLEPYADRWRMVVRDNGIGAAARPAVRGGIGSDLVRALASQLGGEISLGQDHGTEFQLMFSAEDGDKGTR